MDVKRFRQRLKKGKAEWVRWENGKGIVVVFYYMKVDGELVV